MNSVTRALDMMSDKPDTHGVCVKLGDLRKLSAHVEELEAALDSKHASVGSNIWRFWRDQALDIARSKSDAEKAARRQGLDEAVCEIDNATSQEAYNADCRIHFDDLQDFFSTRVEALKEQQS